ncbi:lymphotoxin-alpha [Channa argus]|uniref:lymphotoxin-alpha n=1 Tax=Channa argus TaxID=215402 RepID=UPI002944D502|nr:hypothetical protein Q8A73_007592 [Channa argus]
MEGQSKSSHKYLLLQVWCSLLTVAMVVMAALLTSIKPKSTEDGQTTLKPTLKPNEDKINRSPEARSEESSLSYIQLIKSVQNDSWEITHPSCESCSLVLEKNSIHCKKKSIYFIYAQVTFPMMNQKSGNKYVTLKRDATFGRKVRILVEGTFPNTTVGTVWVAKIVSLEAGDRVSLDITNDDFLKDSSFWGAYELH